MTLYIHRNTSSGSLPPSNDDQGSIAELEAFHARIGENDSSGGHGIEDGEANKTPAWANTYSEDSVIYRGSRYKSGSSAVSSTSNPSSQSSSDDLSMNRRKSLPPLPALSPTDAPSTPPWGSNYKELDAFLTPLHPESQNLAGQQDHGDEESEEVSSQGYSADRESTSASEHPAISILDGYYDPAKSGSGSEKSSFDARGLRKQLYDAIQRKAIDGNSSISGKEESESIKAIFRSDTSESSGSKYSSTGNLSAVPNSDDERIYYRKPLPPVPEKPLPPVLEKPLPPVLEYDLQRERDEAARQQERDRYPNSLLVTEKWPIRGVDDPDTLKKLMQLEQDREALRQNQEREKRGASRHVTGTVADPPAASGRGRVGGTKISLNPFRLFNQFKNKGR